MASDTPIKIIFTIGLTLLFIISLLTPMVIGNNVEITNKIKPQSTGWYHQVGWPITFEVNFSYDNQICDLVICDLEGDNNLDIVVTYCLSETESCIDAFELNGSRKTNLCFPLLLPGKILSEVSIDDLDNNGDVEIVASLPVFTDDFHASVFVFKYDGEKFVESWHFMESKKSGEIMYSPALGDIDGDKDLEIIIGNQRYDKQWNNVLYAFHHNGAMVSGWPIINKVYYGSYYATPALGDIDNDGFLEIIVGSFFKYLYAFNGDGKPVFGRWPIYINDDIRSHSPQLGDLDGDGNIEIIQIGARYGNISIIDSRGNIIKTLHPDIQDFCCTPGLGDIDGDGDLEIFANIGDYIYSWHHNGDNITGNWPVFIGNLAHSARASIIIGDIDDDLFPDIIYMRENITQSSDIFAFHADGTIINEWPYSFDKVNNIRSSPTLIDIDEDGDVEVAFTYYYLVSHPNPLCNYTIDILDLSGSYNPTTMHWPMFQHNSCHTGLYNKPLNNPPEKPSITGTINGNVRIKYTYNAITNDSDGDNISYLFSWGDGTNSGWTKFVSSGTAVNQSHIWWLRGSYKVMVKAKDCYTTQSEWTIIKVKMPKNKATTNSFFLWFFERFFCC